ncbi:MAG TPA: class I SAM-dependent methyltransferase [Acidimicrobiales bacterium]|jgi:SAM-dependent methyltransferase
MDYDAERAAIYDAIHTTRFEEAATEADRLAELHAAVVERDGRDGRILELGIGTGRVALPLAERGLEVQGVDSSPDMVAALRAKPSGETIVVHHGDFADVGSLVDGEFAVVYIVFNTLFELMSQDDQIRCVDGASEHLSANGVLVIEALAPEATRLEQDTSVVSLDESSVVLRASVHDPVTQQVSTQIVDIRSEGVTMRHWAIRYATVPEIDLMARLAGLRLAERWGGWDREPFTAASARHVSVYSR